MCGISGIFDWNSLKNAEKVASIMKDSKIIEVLILIQPTETII